MCVCVCVCVVVTGSHKKWDWAKNKGEKGFVYFPSIVSTFASFSFLFCLVHVFLGAAATILGGISHNILLKPVQVVPYAFLSLISFLPLFHLNPSNSMFLKKQNKGPQWWGTMTASCYLSHVILIFRRGMQSSMSKSRIFHEVLCLCLL